MSKVVKSFTLLNNSTKSRIAARRHLTGFTLIELLIVIAIIGLLSSLIISSINEVRARTRDAKRLEDLRQVASGLEMYFNDHFHYPVYDSMVGCFDEVPSFLSPEYIITPKDPLPHKYCYCYKTDKSGLNYKSAAYLEKNKENALNDGGTANLYYEIYGGLEQINLTDNDLKRCPVPQKNYLKSAWYFDESGNTNDTLNNNHLTPSGTTPYSPEGKIGGSREFNGSTSFLHKDDNVTGLGGTNKVSLAAWIKRNSLGGEQGQGIFYCGHLNSNENISLKLTTDNKIKAHFGNTGGSDYKALTTNNTLTDFSSWHLIVAIY